MTSGRAFAVGEADLWAIAQSVVGEHRAAPCAVVAAAVRRDGEWRHGLGAAGRLWFQDEAPRADVETPFDLASLTKPFTALALARLARQGRAHRDEALADLLPELSGTASARVSLDLLSAHRAGLEGHVKLYAPLLGGREVDSAAALAIAASARRAGCDGAPPLEGFPPVYSDLGYLLLGEAIAARAASPLDEVIRREVSAPLGLTIGSARQMRARDARFDERVAPTEDVPFRGGVVRGLVHDENAFAMSGDAASGHAGLFGDARSVARLGVAVLDALAGRAPGWLDPEDIAPLVRPRPGGSLLAGFDRRSGEAPLSGARFGPQTFGHLGFTGTSLWMDPEAERVGVLLTNRVHPTRDTQAIRKARPAVYDALVEAMG